MFMLNRKIELLTFLKEVCSPFVQRYVVKMIRMPLSLTTVAKMESERTPLKPKALKFLNKMNLVLALPRA